jgi:hypothetical protein
VSVIDSTSKHFTQWLDGDLLAQIDDQTLNDLGVASAGYRIANLITAQGHRVLQEIRVRGPGTAKADEGEALKPAALLRDASCGVDSPE